MRSILLVFDDPKESEFMEANLLESGAAVSTTHLLSDALAIAQSSLPELIVINTHDTQQDLKSFYSNVKKDELKHVIVLTMIDLQDYFQFPSKDHVLVKPLRPKLFLSLIRGIMNHEEISWLPAIQAVG
ncbi:MAG: hypothetical protein M3R27_04085 [Bacteroidota bacterium]|nr:hypothetical protein [Bacteroidota bacterium]